MALNAVEVGICAALIDRLKPGLGRRPRLLFLGNPDLLCTLDALRQVGVEFDTPVKTRGDGPAIWDQHGRHQLRDLPMLDARSAFTELGADVTISDAIAWGGEDLVLDLNRPIGFFRRLQLAAFDLVVDPGTIEHCFNIAQAFDNIDRLLAPFGIVYHQTAAAFPNHGFWSVSPTAFFDFYESRQFELGTAYYWNGSIDADGLVPRLQCADPFAPKVGSPTPQIACYTFRKRGKHRRPPGFPVQRCYSSLSREIATTNFVPQRLLLG
ncbi:MAG TPA: hypothetical protein VKX28_02615 [Xanthobacteraceae bacterium]|nr:hypothetical protein [Xanthobacteraceae bacterium]